MKSPGSLLFHLVLAASLFLFSCTRAVEDNHKASVTISLPTSHSIKKFTSNLSTLALPPTTSPADYASPAAGEYAPEPAGPTETYSENCYMVVVGYPEATANRNFCGTKPTAVPAAIAPIAPPPINADDLDVDIIPSFYFSQNFKGLINPNDTTPIELPDIYVGTNRTFTILAVPTSDVSQCKDILSQSFNKSSMLGPRIVGAATVDIRAGNNNPVSIVIDTANYTSRFDDCIITDTVINYPHAEKTVIDQDNFPFNFMRGYAGENNPYVCQPITVGLRARVAGSLREVPAALNFDTPTEIYKRNINTGVTSIINTYNSHENCLNDTSSSQGKSDFNFPRNQHQKKRWIQVTESTGVQLEFTAAMKSSTELTRFEPATFKVQPGTYNVFDNNFPRVMQFDTCYKVSTSIRNLKGILTPHSGSGIVLSNQGTSDLQFYDTNANCDAGSASGPIKIFTSTNGVEYYVKIPAPPTGTLQSGSPFEFFPSYTGAAIAGGTTAAPKPTVAIGYASIETQKTQVSNLGGALEMGVVGPVPSYNMYQVPNTAGGCYPVTINVTNKLGATFATNPGYLDFDFLLKDQVSRVAFQDVPLRIQVVDLARDGNVGGYTVKYGGSISNAAACTYMDMLPIGTVGTVSGTPVWGGMPNNGSSYTLFLKTAGDGFIGRRRLQLFYGGSSDTTTATTIGYPAGQIDFELTTPD